MPLKAMDAIFLGVLTRLTHSFFAELRVHGELFISHEKWFTGCRMFEFPPTAKAICEVELTVSISHGDVA
jgi:hypothetical protein